MKRITAILAGLLLVGGACTAAGKSTPAHAFAAVRPVPHGAGGPLRILALGDSITAAGVWQATLDQELTAAGVPHVIETEAVGGTRCSYWPPRVAALLAMHQPDLVYLYCGTNDDPTVLVHGEPETRWSERYVIEAVHGYRPADPALIVPTLVGYSDATMAPAWLIDYEARNNDNLYSQMMLYPSSWLGGIGNVQQMPGTGVYLDGDTCDPVVNVICAIHPNPHGWATIGALLYNAAAARMGWPPVPTPCGMSGHRNYIARPAYTPCPAG